MKKALLMVNRKDMIEHVYGDRRATIEKLCDCFPSIVESEDFEKHPEAFSECQVIFSTWSMPALSSGQVALMPDLEAVFYAAGSVKYFAAPFLQAGVRVFSAWQANAVPVAEFTLAGIILGLKGALTCIRSIHDSGEYGVRRPPTHGAYGATVGIVSLGGIGRKVCSFLRMLNVDILAYDPCVDDEVFRRNNAQRTDLDTLFSESHAVSIHAPAIDATRGMITGRHLRLMKPWSTFINTARPSIVKQKEFAETLPDRPDITVILDLVDESDESTSELLRLPNVFVTPHIAGSQDGECRRMADCMIRAFRQWESGGSVECEVTADMLATMA